MILTPESKVTVDLSVQKDGDEYTVGSSITGTFIRVPYEAVAIIELLDGTNTIEEITTQLQKREIDVDVSEFVTDLKEIGLVAEIDGEACEEAENTSVPFNENVKRLGMVFYNPITIPLYVILSLSCIGLFIYKPALLPSYEDMFVFESMGLSLLVLFVLSWGLTILHEIGHYLAAVRLGIPVTFRLSLRLYWLVVEADMTGLCPFQRIRGTFLILGECSLTESCCSSR